MHCNILAPLLGLIESSMLLPFMSPLAQRVISTPMPELGFPGLKPGDRWCLCAPRWQEALDASQAPRVVLRATHEGALAHCSLADLKRHAMDLS
jgi:uncharacterized protein (DUF2237 family)